MKENLYLVQVLHCKGCTNRFTNEVPHVLQKKPFQLYSNIINNSLIKTDYVANLSVPLINLLLNHSGWLI